MNSTAAPEPKGIGQPRPARGEQEAEPRLAVAREVAQLLAKGVRALRLYDPANPAVRRFEEELRTTLGRALEEGEALSLVIQQDALLFAGKPVYTDPDRNEGLPFRLYQDGVREVAFRPGLEGEEIGAFLAALRAGIDARAGDEDLVTLLWQRDLPHIGCAVVDEMPEAEAAPASPVDLVPLAGGRSGQGSPPGGPTARTLPRGIGKPDIPTSAAVPIPPPPSHEQLTALQSARMTEERQSPADGLADLLLDLAALAEESDDYPTILGFLERAVGAAVERGDLLWATRILRGVRMLAGHDQALPAAHRDLLRQAVARMAGPSAAAPLAGLINKAQVRDSETLEAFIQVLDDEAIPAVCDVLGELTSRRDRRRLCDILVRRVGDNIGLLASGLADSRWYVVRNVASILGQTGHPAAAAPLRRALDHPEPRVGREAMRGLEALGMHQDPAFLAPLLDARSAPVQMWALERLAVLKDPRVVSKLLALIQASDFEDRPFGERRRLFGALGRAGTNDLLPMLKKLLAPARLFGRARTEERQLCAIAALGVLGTSEARALLTEGLKSSTGTLAAAYRAALAGTREVPGEEAGEE